MKKLIKSLSLVLCLVLVFGTLAGCKEEANQDGMTTITMWTADGGSKAVMVELVNEFNKTIGKENGVVLDYEVKEGNLKEQIELALTTDQAPDLFITDGIDKYSENGNIAAIEDMPGGKELVAKYEGNLNYFTHTYEGKTYCLPFSTNTYALIYNKDMFKAAGLVDENGEAKAPETFDELREYAKKLTNKSKKEFGIILPLKWGSWIYQELCCNLMSSYGRSYYDPVRGEYDYSIMQKPLEMIMGIKEDQSFYPGAENIDNDTARARFAEGGIGMKFAVSWDVGVLNDQFPAKCDWGVAPLPVEDVNNKYLQHSGGNTGPYINKKSLETKDAEKIMVVYNWFHSDELMKKLYEEGVYIPWNYDIIKDVKLENAKKGWVEFAALGEISKMVPPTIKSDTSGQDTPATVFNNEIWTGKTKIDVALQKLNKIAADGVARYKEVNPEYDSSYAILKEWDIKR